MPYTNVYQKNALTLFLSFSSAQAMQEFVTDVVPCLSDKHPIGKSMVCPVHTPLLSLATVSRR